MDDGLYVPRSSSLFPILCELSTDARLVFLAGLPGTGKSLFINQLAHLAARSGRSVDLLQWDVARPVFEATPTGQSYPQVGGVTHGFIRIAASRWARQAVSEWSRRNPGRERLLIGETPLIGHRFMELARTRSDDAESVLTDSSTRFVIPVPSRDVRRHAESERVRRFDHPRHPREKEDAPPEVMRESFRQIMEAARALGLASAAEYDPDAYAGFYAHLLRHRNSQVAAVTEIFPASESSAYRFLVPTIDLTPSPEAAENALVRTRSELNSAELHRQLEGWFVT